MPGFFQGQYWYRACVAFAISVPLEIVRGLMHDAIYYAASTTFDYIAVWMTSAIFAIQAVGYWWMAAALRQEGWAAVRAAPFVMASIVLGVAAVENIIEDVLHVPIGWLYILLFFVFMLGLLLAFGVTVTAAGKRLLAFWLLSSAALLVVGDDSWASAVVGAACTAGLAVATGRLGFRKSRSLVGQLESPSPSPQ